MGKGKGHQAGTFGSKKLRAAFVMEWQSRAEEVPLRRRRKLQQAPDASRIERDRKGRTRPKLHLSQLKGLLQEREFHDRIEYHTERRRRQQSQSAMSDSVSQQHAHTPGEMVYWEDRGVQATGSSHFPSLASLCIEALVPVLPDYLDSMGRDQLQYSLSLLPGPTLTTLSVLMSRQRLYSVSDDLLFSICHHVHVKRIAVWGRIGDNASLLDEQGIVTDEGLLRLLPENNTHLWFQSHVPDSWEQYVDGTTATSNILIDDYPLWQGRLSVERVELGSLLHVTGNAMLQFLQKCPLITHLSLSGSLGYDSGPDVVLQLHHVLPRLQVLDVSCCVWVTEGLLRRIWSSYEESHGKFFCPVIRAAHCLTRTESVTLELEYPENYHQAGGTLPTKQNGTGASVGVNCIR